MPLKELIALMSVEKADAIRRVLEAAQERKARRHDPIAAHERRMELQAARRAKAKEAAGN
jgi:hypothetical protein